MGIRVSQNAFSSPRDGPRCCISAGDALHGSAPCRLLPYARRVWTTGTGYCSQPTRAFGDLIYLQWHHLTLGAHLVAHAGPRADAHFLRCARDMRAAGAHRLRAAYAYSADASTDFAHTFPQTIPPASGRSHLPSPIFRHYLLGGRLSTSPRPSLSQRLDYRSARLAADGSPPVTSLPRRAVPIATHFRDGRARRGLRRCLARQHMPLFSRAGQRRALDAHGAGVSAFLM